MAYIQTFSAERHSPPKSSYSIFERDWGKFIQFVSYGQGPKSRRDNTNVPVKSS